MIINNELDNLYLSKSHVFVVTKLKVAIHIGQGRFSTDI